MIEFLVKYSAMLFVSIAVMFIFKSMYENKVVSKTYYVFICILLSFVLYFSFIYINPFVRMIMIIIIYFLMSYFLYNRDIKLSILDSLYLEIICIFAEAIYTTIYLILNSYDNLMVWNHSPVGLILSNTIIPIIMIVLSKLGKLNALSYRTHIVA